MAGVEFRIADTFTDSLARLTGDEQKAVKTTAFDLQIDPANPGMKFHKLDRARDKSFWSIRVSRDIRLIAHKTASSLLLCYVDHHDAAYRWAERRRIEQHPTTGAAQLVEVRETVREIEIPRYVDAAEPAPPDTQSAVPLAGTSAETLLGYGVPQEWIDDIRAADEASLLDLIDRLPGEASEAVLQLAAGETPEPFVWTAAKFDQFDPFDHPDAQRRFRVMADREELQRALDFPWEKWTVFLHPAQRSLVERRYNGPARVSGSAGTGKTIVAIHRAVQLTKQNPGARVLLTTFSIALAKNLRHRLHRLIGDDADLRARIQVRAIDEVGIDHYEAAFGKPTIPTPAMLRTLLESATAEAGDHGFPLRFVEAEWHDVVDAWQLESWEAYRDVARLGRKTRLGEKQRAALWPTFARIKADLYDRGLVTTPTLFAMATEHVQTTEDAALADFVVVDEAQDISVPQLRFLAALAGSKEDGLFFAGDLGQRIFQTPFSWKSLGVDVRGRSHTLRINYRTSHQIRRQADRLLPPQLADVDGISESRRGTVSVFNGPEPLIKIAGTEEEEIAVVGAWLAERAEQGLLPNEMGVFVRSPGELPRARRAVTRAGLGVAELDPNTEVPADHTTVASMHLAKGLEFRAVAVMACDDEVVPLQARIEAVGDESDLREVYDTERHLLYVACTRARDHLLVTGVKPASEFLDDLTSS